VEGVAIFLDHKTNPGKTRNSTNWGIKTGQLFTPVKAKSRKGVVFWREEKPGGGKKKKGEIRTL